VADEVAGLQCPSCGSTKVTAVPLSLISTRYYQCGNCVVTFRAPATKDEYPDLERFNQGWSLPPGEKPKT
jgi:predicted RNA-binding Zn-ribbon protein involved in translation (DUF1610 family)